MVFAIIGGDRRMIYLGERLSSAGHTVRMCGFERYERHIPCLPAGDALFGAQCVILPIVSTKDGRTVWTPLGENEILLSDLLAAANDKTLFLTAGGKIGAVRECDYLSREELSVLNAVPTAEGAIETAIKNTERTLWHSSCLVIGFGRIGKLLCHRLSPFGCKLTATARRPETHSLINAYGYNSLDVGKLESALTDFDIIFNTVPKTLIKERELECIRPDTLIIELASAPYGIDLSAAEKHEIRVIKASGLPAITAPRTAADIIFSTVNNILEEYF